MGHQYLDIYTYTGNAFHWKIDIDISNNRLSQIRGAFHKLFATNDRNNRLCEQIICLLPFQSNPTLDSFRSLDLTRLDLTAFIGDAALHF
jgi:hypothetical protein